MGFFAGGGQAARGEQVVPAHDFGADEAFFDVAVDFPAAFTAVVPLSNGPGADFGFAGGEIRM